MKFCTFSIKSASIALVFAIASTTFASETERNELSVAAPQVQQYLNTAFPREYEALGGLFTLTARDPELSIPATGERLNMGFSASASSPGGTDAPVGRILMSSGLRYDPGENALYMDEPTVDDVQPAAQGQRIDEQTRVLLNLWLADYARKEPLYRLDPALLANLGGVKVESARIRNGQIVVRFNQPVGMPDLDDAQY